ncbi:MAG: lipocalin family protein [Bacteroidales bacterium]|nr:lipocalin family protein [Bacteroidales bacterium]
MNKSRTLIMLVAAAFAAMSCESVLDGGDAEQRLEVNANNISGQWELMTWNGEFLNEATYVYIDIVRNDRTYTMYQNIDSFSDVPHRITGSYYLENDPETGAVIRGNYDHDSGDWAHRYIITDLTQGQMTWTAKDNPEYIQVWHRIESIPVAE